MLRGITPLCSDKIPRSSHYYHFFKSLEKNPPSFWEGVPNPQDIQPGDLLSYAPLDPNEFQKYHTGVVKNILSISNAGKEVEVTVIDYAGGPHSFDFDSRPKAAQGLGLSIGTFNFSPGDSSVQWGENGVRKPREIAVGRVLWSNSSSQRSLTMLKLKNTGKVHDPLTKTPLFMT